MRPNSNVSSSFSLKLHKFFNVNDVFTLRNLLVMSLMAAVAAVLSRFSLYITPTFKAVSFAYLPGTIVAMLFGPWAALAFGIVSDNIIYFTNPQGGYFPGYTISEMLTYFIYACFLYRQSITIWRVVLARILILIIVVFGLNFLWTSMMYGTAASGYFTGIRLINNLVQLPFHALLITFLGKQLVKLKEHFPA